MIETDILEIISKITAAIKQNPLAEDVTIDGTRVSMPDAHLKLEFWEAKLAKVQGKRPKVARINLSGFTG